MCNGRGYTYQMRTVDEGFGVPTIIQYTKKKCSLCDSHRYDKEIAMDTKDLCKEIERENDVSATGKTLNAPFNSKGSIGIDDLQKAHSELLSHLPWNVRLLYEARELMERVEKLQAFLKSDKYKELDEEDQALLTQQCNAMLLYHYFLYKRVDKCAKEGK